MDKDTITKALKQALEGGSGNLDDLDKLLDKVKADVAQAKKDEEVAAARAKAEQEQKEKEAARNQRGEAIAALAQRMLDGKLTDDDVAEVIKAYFAQKGEKVEIKGKDIAEGYKAICEFKSSLDNLMMNDKHIFKRMDKMFDDLFNLHFLPEPEAKKENTKPKAQPKGDDIDQIINDFLRRNGLA